MRGAFGRLQSPGAPSQLRVREVPLSFNVENIDQNVFLITLYSLDLGTSGIFCFSVSSLVMFFLEPKDSA